MPGREESLALTRDAATLRRLIEDHAALGSDEAAHLNRLASKLSGRARELWPSDDGQTTGIPGHIGSHSWRVSTVEPNGEDGERAPLIEVYAKRGSTFGTVRIRREDASVVAAAIVKHAKHGLGEPV